MTEAEIPEWAVEKAVELSKAEAFHSVSTPNDLLYLGTGRALARYIAAHEEAPVDPLLIEAREICASMPGLDALQAAAYRRGAFDVGSMVASARIALRRGIELAGEQGK